MIRRLAPMLVALVLLAAACGDDDAASDDDAAPPEAADVDEGSGDSDEESGESTGDASVTIQNFAFEPDSIDVAAGTTVTWTNEDGVAHTVTSGSPGDADGTFDESVDSDSTVEIQVDEPGTYPYFCAIHPNMTAELVVS